MSTNFSIVGRHVEVTPAIDSYTRKKLSKLETVFNNITTIHVILSIDNKEQKAEAEVKVPGDQHTIFAESTTDDMYKSIDMLEDKLLKQVKKYHDKLKDHHSDK